MKRMSAAEHAKMMKGDDKAGSGDKGKKMPPWIKKKGK